VNHDYLYSIFSLCNSFYLLVISWVAFNHSYLEPLFGSTLSGNHGVPRVHYKGKQAEFYIMVLDNELRIFVSLYMHKSFS
jgi:hypothetical protein